MTDNKQVSSSELSTSNLAKELKLSTKAMFQLLVDTGLISRNGDTWDLTPVGKSKGGIYRQHQQYGRYIVWPPSIISELDDSQEKHGQNLITATSIGEKYDIPANRINSILSELGWLRKANIKGWDLTDLGKRLGGVQSKYTTTGVPYVRWPENVLINKLLITSIREAKGDTATSFPEKTETKGSDSTEFRDKFKPEHRAIDGHNVRSKSELIIDNWLYHSKIVHAYERKLPIEEEVYCDFYIPTGKVYIEYWGLDEEKYLSKKNWKLEIYKKNGFNLIELFEKDISNLDDKLPAKLLDL